MYRGNFVGWNFPGVPTGEEEGGGGDSEGSDNDVQVVLESSMNDLKLDSKSRQVI